MQFVSRIRAILPLALIFALSACDAKKPSSKAKAAASGAAVASAAAPVAAPPPKHNIFLVLEYRNEAPEYVHSAWFMDTEGNEYRFVAKSVADDVMFKVLEDSQMNASEIEQLIAASKPLPKRASAESLSKALAARDAIEVDPVEHVSAGPCNEIGQVLLYAYVLEPRLGVLTPRFLHGEQCQQVVSRNPSVGASALSDWLEKLGKPKLLSI
ncbi:MAG TPA: hypothetical protein VG937_02030 [Polyangiaceae bacterium]|jgi:hypothetical protein|nr:hypothetical protein [Polyangiaceae bacterium]